MTVGIWVERPDSATPDEHQTPETGFSRRTDATDCSSILVYPALNWGWSLQSRAAYPEPCQDSLSHLKVKSCCMTECDF